MAEGAKHWSVELREENARLRAEVEALRARLAAGEGGDGATATASGVALSVLAPAPAPSDWRDSDEWRFIEKAIAETEVDFKSGAVTGMFKKLYQLLQFKVVLWRAMREVVPQVGVGGPWPQFVALGRSEDTGARKVERAPVTPPEAEAEAPAPPMHAVESRPGRSREVPAEFQGLAAMAKSMALGGPA
jgi:hypothetical protein